jgi:hypothetical protein
MVSARPGTEKMNLKRVDLQEDPFTSAALVFDEAVKDRKIGKMVALVSYSPGGHVVVLFKEGYVLEEILVSGEKFVGESLEARRVKVFKAVVQKV